jgi:hypothetical protein
MAGGSAPRGRGGDPYGDYDVMIWDVCSPRDAGVIRRACGGLGVGERAPSRRGGDPPYRGINVMLLACSPRTRG